MNLPAFTDGELSELNIEKPAPEKINVASAVVSFYNTYGHI